MATFRDLIHASFRDIGVFSPGEAAPHEDANDALIALNNLLDQFATDRLALPKITRTAFDVTANLSEYQIGDVSNFSDEVTDGFDTTWTGTPPGWTITVTSSGVANNSTTIYQAGGHSLNLSVPALGTAQADRDFTVFCGNEATITLYMRGAGGNPAITRLQCVETSHYLTSAGLWQAGSSDLFTQSAAAFAAKTLTFDVEDALVVGADTCTLRVTFYIDSFLTDGYYDTFSLSNAVPEVVDIPRPVSAENMTVKLVNTSLSPELETPLIMHTDDSWAGVTQKDATSVAPTHWYYETTYPFGTLHLWPVPTGSDYEIAIYTPTPVLPNVTLDDTVTLPPAWYRMLQKNLALELAPSYPGCTVSQLLVKAAAESLASVKRSNIKPLDMSFDSATLTQRRSLWDIRYC